MPRTKYPIFKCLHRGEKGFTLIELLIVIAILGIIGAVVALNVGGFLGAGTKQAAIIEKDTVQVAILGAMADHGATSMTTIADYGLKDTASSITLQYGGADHATDLKPTYLTGSIQGAYGVSASGSLTGAKYPEANPEFKWSPSGGWEPWT